MASARPGLRSIGEALGAFLRAGGRRDIHWDALPRGAPLALILACGGLYGAIMAGYGGVAGDRWLAVLYGVIKVPILFGATMLIAVPCFYVVNALKGVGDDFPEVWRGLVDYQLSVAVQLAALAPVTLFINLTNGDYRVALTWSTLLFGATSWNARRSLDVRYAPLIERNPTHRMLARFWFVVYAFVGIQMGWDLRPFVGSPHLPVQFFRDEIGNAYLEIWKIFMMFLRDAMRME